MLKGYAAKISDVPVFNAMNTGLRARLAEIISSIGEPRVLKKDEVLYAKGAEDENTGAVLVDGALTVSSDDGPLLTVTAPDLLGEMLQFDSYGQRTATVTAAGPATVLEFRWHDFIARVRDTPAITHEDQALLKRSLESYASKRMHQL
jgi:CRP-like cAMP-binding protein